ncbi:glyoxylase-like metal-dependent hydrolase (beta-lactamase superfamily II) [Mycobacterium sp. MAA66]
MTLPYTKGLHQVGDGVWAWLAPDGSWGLSNAGLIAGESSTLLVDTLFDLELTREMLAAMSAITGVRPIADLVNTHANGDHCYGNQLLDNAVRIHAAPEAIHEMHEVPPQVLDTMLGTDLGPTLTPYLRRIFGQFRFDDITVRVPDTTVSGTTTIDVSGRVVQVLPLGPAHTHGDVAVWVPDASVLFTGDLLFIDGSPIMWAGPTASWIAACDTMLELNPSVVVPGHGPVTDASGIRAVRDYMVHVGQAVRAGVEAGKTWQQTATDIDLGRFATLPDAERIAITVYHEFRALDPATPPADIAELFTAMAQWDATR